MRFGQWCETHGQATGFQSSSSPLLCFLRVRQRGGKYCAPITYAPRGTLIRGSLLLLERKLIVVFYYQCDVFLELNGLCLLERSLKLRQVHFLLRLRDRFVGLNRG